MPNLTSVERLARFYIKTEKYIKENTKTKDLCPVCSSPLVFSDGCKTCISCGWSKCD